MMTNKCGARILKGTGYYATWVPCWNAAKVERDGKPFCGVHDPTKAEARYKKRNAALDAKVAESERRRIRHQLEVKYCARFTNEELEKLVAEL